MAHLKGDESPMINYDWGRVFPIHPPYVGSTPTHEVQGVFPSGAHTQLRMDSQGVFPFGTQAQPMMGSGTMPQGALHSRTQKQSMMSSGFQRNVQFSDFCTMAENMQVDSFLLPKNLLLKWLNHKHDDCFRILGIGYANPSTGMLKKVAELTVIEPTMCTEHQRAIAEQQR